MANGADKLGSLLGKAQEHERDFKWIEAADSYKKALELLPENEHRRRGDVAEMQSYALYKAAFQVADNAQFRDRIGAAAELSKRARTEYGEDGSSAASALRCAAMIPFLNYWVATDAAAKKRLVNESWNLAREALSAFEQEGDDLGYAHTFNRLSMAAGFACMYESDADVLKKRLVDGLTCAEKSISILSRTPDNIALARAYMHACRYQQEFGSSFAEKVVKLDPEGYSHLKKTLSLSEETSFAEIPSVTSFVPLPIPSGPELSSLLEKAVEFGKRINDRLVTGHALREQASEANWAIIMAQDSDERESLASRVFEIAKECRRELAIVQYETSMIFGEVWVTLPEPGVCGILAYFESDIGKKRELAEKAVEASVEFIRLAENLGVRDIIWSAHHQYGYNLTSLAKTEQDQLRKRTLLEKALQERGIVERFSDSYCPNDYWFRGTNLSLRAEAEVELADLEKNDEERVKRLRDATQHKKESLGLHFKSMSLEAIVDPSYHGIIGHWQIQYSSWLEKLHSLDHDKNTLRAAAVAWSRTANAFENAGIPARAAEASWKAAQVLDDLQEHGKSAENFVLASNAYKTAAEKLPQLRDFYQDHAAYMQAWAEIERAKTHHARDEPGLAKGYYENAAVLHDSTKRWKALARLYSAWAQVENAEDLSRNDRCQEAAEAYRHAECLFKESKEALRGMMGTAQESDEGHMTTRIMKAAAHRETFCRARVILEEARILDRQGDSAGSSDKFGLAAEMFTKVQDGLEEGDDRREIELIATLSKAWRAMARAEAETSPELYGEASLMFDKAKELASSEKSRLMSMGHSRFCKALESGTRFSDTGDASLHASASRDLDSASKYYLKADLFAAAEYSKASKLLFDGYAYMDKAGKEEDQDRKAKLYAMAEKVLSASASSYEKAGQPGKNSQVLKLLARVRDERELAISLAEVLRAPDIVSTTMAFSTPTPARERAVGVERFEHADVQVTLIARPKELHVGEDFNLEIEVVNAGRGPAQLTKVDKFIPEGFDVVSEPDKYRIEDSYLNMKGRRLDALKTEDVRLVLKPKVQGRFTVRPRVMYLDEAGTYKSSEPEPVDVTVKELGISGWLKGPEKKRQSAQHRE